MQVIKRDTTQIPVGYESLVWVNDEKGRGFSCTLVGTECRKSIGAGDPNGV